MYIYIESICIYSMYFCISLTDLGGELAMVVLFKITFNMNITEKHQSYLNNIEVNENS